MKQLCSAVQRCLGKDSHALLSILANHVMVQVSIPREIVAGTFFSALPVDSEFIIL